MARKAIYKHATQVDTNTYPDDGSSPVGSNEWNESPDQAGMFGNTPTTATVTIASGVATVTDSVTVVAAESSTSDTLDKLAITNTSQYDLVYLFADTGDTITLTNTSSPSADGHIKTVSGSNETLSSTVPTILIRKGNYWYGYGGGVVNAVSDIGDVTITNNSSGEILKWNGSAWINQTLAEADIGSATAVAANTAKVTNATHTGDVTGSGALTIADNAVTLAKMAGGTDGELITYDANGDPATVAVGTATHVLTSNGAGAAPTFQAAAGGGATIVHAFSNTATTTYTGTASSFGTVGSGDRDIYIKKIDANNEGVFTKIWKNVAAVEVQIA